MREAPAGKSAIQAETLSKWKKYPLPPLFPQSVHLLEGGAVETRIGRIAFEEHHFPVGACLTPRE